MLAAPPSTKSAHISRALASEAEVRPQSHEDPALEKEVRAFLPVLAVLRRQLTETIEQVEQAVVQTCASFQGIADRSRESVTRSAQCLSSACAEEMIDVTRQILGRFLERIEQARAQSLRTIAMMHDVQAGMQDIEKILRKVDSITEGTKILALNARIEAARAGERGKAFGVVAAEMGRVAHEARQTGTAIRAIVQQVAGNVDQLATDLREQAAASEAEAQASQSGVDHALAVLTATHEEMRRSVEDSVRCSEEVGRDVERAVIGLQFQDAVSQRVTHVVQTLQAIEESLDAHVIRTPTETNADVDKWAEYLRNSYTMAGERRSAEEVLGRAADSGDAAGNITLF